MNDKNFSDFSPEEQKKIKEDYEKSFSNSRAHQESTGVMYLRNLVFMNGGALVAILSAKAALMANDVENIEWTFDPMVWFFIGLVLAAFLNGSKYMRFVWRGHKLEKIHISFTHNKITENCFQKKKSSLNNIDRNWFRIEIGLSFLGLLFFILGGCSVFTSCCRIL